MGLVSIVAALLSASPGAKPTADPRPQLAFVLLAAPALPRGDAVLAAFRQVAADADRPPKLASGDSASSLELAIGKGGSLLVSLMPVPVPKGEADRAFAHSFSAVLGDRTTLAPHRAHLVAVFLDEPGRSRHDGLTRFTYLLASIAEASKASAIYWGDAGATHDARLFIETARARDRGLMLPLWCGFEVVADGPDRASLLTLGMRRQLGIMELRVTAPRRTLGESVGAMFDLLAYAVRRGSAVPEGDTVGRTADERLKVRYERSPADPKERIWRVDFP